MNFPPPRLVATAISFLRSFPGIWRQHVLELLANESGAVLVEFTIIFIPFVLLTFGTIEYGRLSWIRDSMSEVAIMTARCMGIPQQECADNGQYSEQKARSYLMSMASQRSVDLQAADITLDASAECGGIGDFASVHIDYSFVSTVPAVARLLSGGLPLSASACFPNQNLSN